MANTQSFLDFLGSPGGRAATDFAGGALSAYGQYQQNQQNNKQNAQQFAAQQRSQDYWARQNQNTQRAGAVLNADPLGADQKYAQRNALMSAILPGLRNSNYKPGDSDVAATMGSGGGGFKIPEGGFDPMMVSNLFGNNATMGAITQRHQEISNLDPNAPTADLGSMYGPESAPYVQQMQDWAHKAQTADASERAQYEQQMNALINQMVQKEKGSGFWHKFAKIAGMVGAVAATVMTAGGASPLLVGAVGAASGAASSFGSGGNPLTGAIIGGTGGYIGARAGQNPAQSAARGAAPQAGNQARFGYNPQTSIFS